MKTQISIEEMAGRLYTAYCGLVGNVNFQGEPLPDWSAFSADPVKAKQVNAWLGVASEAKCLHRLDMAEAVEPMELKSTEPVLTRRDEFAKGALTGLIANDEMVQTCIRTCIDRIANGGKQSTPESVAAERCYKFADAMEQSRLASNGGQS